MTIYKSFINWLENKRCEKVLKYICKYPVFYYTSSSHFPTNLSVMLEEMNLKDQTPKYCVIEILKTLSDDINDVVDLRLMFTNKHHVKQAVYMFCSKEFITELQMKGII